MAYKTETQNTIHDKTLNSVSDLVEIAGRLSALTIVVPGGHRAEDLQLIESVRDHGIVDRIYLVGNKTLISKVILEIGIEIPKKDIIPANSDEEIAAATVGLVKEGGVDIVLKGGISTPVLNRHMLQISVRPTVSLVSIFDASPIADGRPMILTDAGVTTVCNFGRLVGIINNAIEVARLVMGISRPKVAVLSANEKLIPSLPSTQLGKDLTGMSWGEAEVYGPLSFDLAIDPGSVAVKGLPDIPAAKSVAGQADILVCPGLDAANILYKAITTMTKYGQASLSCITVGFQVPYVILSRADTLDTRINSIALCSVYSQRRAASVSEAKYGNRKKRDSYRVLTVRPGPFRVKTVLFENGKPIQQGDVPCSGGCRDVEDISNRIHALVESWDGFGIEACAANGTLPSDTKTAIQEGTYSIAYKKEGKVSAGIRFVSAEEGQRGILHGDFISVHLIVALAAALRVPGFIVFHSVDEPAPEAVVSGCVSVLRQAGFSSLNIKIAAKSVSASIGRPYDDINMVVAHIGEEITVAAVVKGRVVDCFFSFPGDDTFSSSVAGKLPAGDLIDLSYSGKHSRKELIFELARRVGIISYLEEDHINVLENRIVDGDKKACLLIDAMVYQIAKEIGAMYTAVGGAVEVIVLTGELVKSKIIRDSIRSRILYLAPVIVLDEYSDLKKLAEGVSAVLSKEKKHLFFRPKKKEN
jgi:butyrate kinase